ncbi:MAG TPA: PEP-CTERM sorting domain-containing protein [Gemmataceae bacterium]|jgi:hypothetical protein|nr:PEP-CTERM sorting domain-containing protein [Gemmataceae bacterium]
MRKLKVLALSSFLVLPLLVAAHAQAGYITGELNGTTIDTIISPGAWVTMNLGNGSTPSVLYKPGIVKWSLVATDSAIPHNFTAFCLELTQDISPGVPYTYRLANLADAPNPGSAATGGASGMGPVKANEISQLWGAFHSSIGKNGTLAAAFQLDIWKIEYDWGDASFDQFSGGNFRATAYQGNTGPLAQAKIWLDDLKTNKYTPAVDLVAMTDPRVQDQLTELAPEPSTLTLLGIGLAGLAGYTWRLRRRKPPASV